METPQKTCEIFVVHCCFVLALFYFLILVDLHPDILHMARVKPLSEKACKTGWGDTFSMKSLLCTDAAASTSCLVQPYSSFNNHYSHAHVLVT